MMPLLCLGSVEDLAQRAADRRALQGPPEEGVVDAWKAVFENVQVDVNDDDRLCADGCWWRSPRENVQKVLFEL